MWSFSTLPSLHVVLLKQCNELLKKEALGTNETQIECGNKIERKLKM
jgi:hypothetical protein